MPRSQLYVSGIELPDDALVARGGTLQIKDLRKNALDTHYRHEFFGVSAWAGIDVGFEDLMIVANIFNSYVATTTAGDIRAAGFTIELTGPPRHCSIDLGQFPSDAVLVRLKKAFGDFVANPNRIKVE